MANDAEILEELDAIASEFDPTGFIEGIRASIKAVQSENPPKPHEFFEEPVDTEQGEKGESELNAFLRVIGFPATRDESKLFFPESTIESNEFQSGANRNFTVDENAQFEYERKRALSQQDSLNYFNISSFGTLFIPGSTESLLVNDRIANALANREAKLSEDVKQADFINMLRDPLSVNSSVSTTSRRVSLFPLIVNADIPVFPKRKRMAPLLFNGDYIENRSRHSRPFIEHVLYARTKAFAGQNSPLRPFLETNIANEVLGENGSEDEKNELIEGLKKFNSLQLQLYQKFIKALKLSAERYVQVKKKAEMLKAKVDWIAVPKAEPSEKVGENKALSEEDKKALLVENAELGQENVVISNKVLDDKISKINSEINKIDSFIQVMPTESLKESDEIRRLGSDPYSKNNIVPDIFVSEFLGLATFEREGLSNVLEGAKQERARAIQQYEVLKSEIMYFTGEFTGLSIFDIISVLAALFTVETKYLVGLLNSSAKERLVENDLYYSVKSEEAKNTLNSLKTVVALEDIAGEGAAEVSIQDSMLAIHTEVEKYFNMVNSFIKAFERGPENKGNSNTPGHTQSPVTVAPGGQS